jgi:hypothetical protein
MPEEVSAAAAAGAAAASAEAARGTCAAADDVEEKYEGLDNPSIVVSPDTPLLRVPVLSLRPTQFAVGKHSVGIKAAKVAKKRDKGASALDAWLKKHPIPCVRGPPEDGSSDSPLYLIDHHHLAAALHSLGVRECYAAVVRDYSSSSPSSLGGGGGAQEDDQQQEKKEEPGGDQQQQQQQQEKMFWRLMRRDGCLWPHDASGKEVAWEELPRRLPCSVAELGDDPYRSLAGLVRRAGGYEKSARPFAEFVWANHLRERVPLPPSEEARGESGSNTSKNNSSVLDVSPLVPLAMAHASHRDAEGLPGFTPAATGT